MVSVVSPNKGCYFNTRSMRYCFTSHGAIIILRAVILRCGLAGVNNYTKNCKLYVRTCTVWQASWPTIGNMHARGIATWLVLHSKGAFALATRFDLDSIQFHRNPIRSTWILSTLTKLLTAHDFVTSGMRTSLASLPCLSCYTEP